jgi:hypothetical protein
VVPAHSTDMSRRLAVNQFVVQPLVIPLAMIMGDEFHNGPPVMAFAERD